MIFDVLGPMRVTGENGTRPVAGVRQRILLGALLARAGQPVPAEQLAEFVWDGEPPDRAVATLRTYMTRLRQGLDPDAAAFIRTADGGYLAEVGSDELDALAFEALCQKTGNAIRATDWASAADNAAGALALWRGTPLGDAPSQVLRDAWLPYLNQQRLQVIEWRIEAGLHLGRHEQLIILLRQLTAEHPLRERFHAQLMLALCRSGRQAEALATYESARAVLAEELGTDPGPELRQLHGRILAGDDADDLTAPCPPTGTAPPAVSGTMPAAAVPHQLPVAAGHFTGRRGELDLITSLHGTSPQTDVPGGTVVISAIDGMAGIGKTALAVHAAHQIAGKFPDGQLFLDLHGHTKGYPPRDPGQALEALLRALDVPAKQIPEDTDARAALYRQHLAGTRTLLLLDNALDEAQVRPLLPAAPGCLVIVTSRRRLRGLHDAQAVALDVLPETDAVTLLRTVIGPAHAAAAGADLAEIAGLCGRLPLALRIAGALLRHRPAWTPGYLAGLLRDEHQRLDVLADGDHDLRAVFGLSYDGLGSQEQLMFRLLPLVPGPEIDAFAAAALLDATPPAATGLLENLIDHNLLSQPAPGRYRLHDLIRAYARVFADREPESGRDAALGRLLNYYAHVAQDASDLIARSPRPRVDGPAPAHAPQLAGPEAARIWLRAERENLEAACGHARDRALDEHAVALAAGLAEILRQDGPLTRALDLHQATAATAQQHDWPATRATALTDLASVRRLTGDLEGAADAATQALETYRAISHQAGEAHALAELGRVWRLTGNNLKAVDAASRVLEICRATGDRNGEATALADLGRGCLQTGDLDGATDAATQALEAYRAIGHQLGEADSLIDLGRVRLMTQNLPEAKDALSQALEIYCGAGYHLGEANALSELGRMRVLTRDLDGAADAATQALEIYRAIGHRSGEASVLAELGRVWRLTGDLVRAGDAAIQALEIYRAAGSRNNEACALNYYASIVAAAGDLPHALELYRQSLAIGRELNMRAEEAIALEGAGDCHLSADETETGVTCLNQALEIYEQLGMASDAERVRARLSSSDGRSS